MDINNAKSRVEELTNLLNYHNNLYYNQDNPEISDYEYDKLLRELEDLEKQFPTLLKKDSPTQKVGGSAGEKFSEVTHTVQMMSLHDSFSHGELLDFDRKVREVVQNPLYVVDLSLMDFLFLVNMRTVYLSEVQQEVMVLLVKILQIT